MSKELDGYRKLYPSYRASFPANAGGIFLAGQVVRLNVCVGRETLREFDGERVAKKKTSSFDIFSEA